MTHYRKNLFVGITVLVALILLGWMILRFSDAPFRLFAKDQMPVLFEAATAEGVSEGTPVYYLGVNVGRVARVARTPDLKGVEIHGLLDPPIPANVEGRIRTQIFGGAAAISLVLVPVSGPEPPEGTDPAPRAATGPVTQPSPVQPYSSLAPNARIRAVFVGLDILPKEYSDLSMELRLTAIQFRESRVIPKMAAAVDTFTTNMDKAGQLIENLNKVVDNEQSRRNIEEAIANFKKTSETATRIAANFEKLSTKADTRLDELANSGQKLLSTTEKRIDETASQLADRLAQVARILDNVQSLTQKVNEGQGTAAMLLNDPVLYENLLDTSRQLNITISTLKRVLDQWEQEGVPFKLGK
jgi:ABC-type transporter Mla subunit MlaD